VRWTQADGKSKRIWLGAEDPAALTAAIERGIVAARVRVGVGTQRVGATAQSADVRERAEETGVRAGNASGSDGAADRAAKS